MKIRIALSALVLTMFLITTSQAQNITKVVEGVILFQSEAHLVRMTDKGKILEFIKDVDNNYTALNKIRVTEVEMSEMDIANAPDLGRSVKSRIDPAVQREMNEIEVANSQQDNDAEMGEAINGSEKKEVVKIDESMTGEMNGEEEMDALIAEATEKPDEDMMSKGDDESAKPTNYDYEFSFDHRDASLSPSVVNQLNQVAVLLKENESATAEIKSFYSETVDISKVLSKNRAKGIQDQLVAKGIDRNRIKISELNNEDWANNRVQLFIY